MIYLLGDTHGNLNPIKKLLSENTKEGDTIIQLGDFGIGFVHEEKLKSLGEKLKSQGVYCYAVRGNHDNPIPFQEGRNWGNLQLLPDNSVLQIEEKSILFLGGAISVDRHFRTLGVDYWSNERFSLNKKYLKNLRGIDMIMAHSCPNKVQPKPTKSPFIDKFAERDPNLYSDLIEDGELINEAFEIMSQNNKIKNWYFGHWHVHHLQEYQGCEFRCLDIDEVFCI